MAKTLLKNVSLGIQIEFFYHWSKWISATENSNTKRNIDIATGGSTNFTAVTMPAKVNLESILTSSAEGEFILLYYKKHLHLSDGVRQSLVDTIVNYYHRNKLKLTIGECAQLSKEITEMFTGEQAVGVCVSINNYFV